MKQYRLINNVIGWLIGIAACVVYIMTAEATASWWDCGEYIATAVKLEVGHPPGGPTFQLLGRIFAMFTTPENAAYAINVMSAVVSGLGIMFLYWTITLLGKLIMRDPEPSVKNPRTWALFFSGIVGAMAYCFSDTYWFSAVEGEVYAMSSFFTAVVFWAILKWEEQSEDPHSLRWLILVCFLVGLAIGVHLLNLLTIPAIVYVVYFKKWKQTTAKGFILSGIISLVILAVVLWGIIPGIVNLSSSFDVFFVNTLHMGFNTGTIVYFLLIAAAIVWGLWYTGTKKKNKPVINAAILGFLMLVIGYSTFFILVIRSNTNTPLNENAPKDAVALRAYLGREQYGQTPLLYGQYYTAGYPIGNDEGYTKYVKGKDENGKDVYIAKAHAQTPVYNKQHCGAFPRMYSNDESQSRQHPQFYKLWAEGGPSAGQKPSMSQNLKYFNRYQLGWMYWRYFMWNFAGRQNDIQGHHFNDDGSIDYMNGNWISGIKFIDAMRLGPQDNITDNMKANKARNTYFLLPLLLGIIGLAFHCKEDRRGAFVNFIMFFMTGLAIAIYLNMPPRQPRERDYAFVGSFYFYAVWIGLGVMALCDWIGKLIKNEKVRMAVNVAVFALCFVAVPVRMCAENWDDHDRSEKTAARDFAKNYMGNLNKQGILVSFGDNDTFPLWYAQEVEGFRTDVRMLNYTLSGMHWYIEQLYNKLYESDPIKLTLPYEEFYGLGHDAILINANGTQDYLEVEDMLKLLRDHKERFTTTVSYGGKTEQMYYLPTKNFKITIDKKKLVEKGVIPADIANEIDSVIRFTINSGQLYRHTLMMLDLIGTNHFERDLYVMGPGHIKDAFPIVETYCMQDGLVYKIVPFQTRPDTRAHIPYTDNSYDYFVNGYGDGKTKTPLAWGNLAANIYVDPISNNMGVVQRQNFITMAEELLFKNDTAKARTILEIADKNFPKTNFPHDKYCIYYINVYNAAFGKEKALEIWNDVYEYYKQDLAYVAQYQSSKNRNYAQGTRHQLQEDCSILYTLADYARKQFKDEALAKKAEDLIAPYSYMFAQ